MSTLADKQKDDIINLIKKINHNSKSVEEGIKKIDDFVKLVLKHNDSLNLIGETTVENIYSRHVIDSLQLIDFIKHDHNAICDLGSGNGFPAIILSLCFAEKNFYLIEKSKLKSHFLKDAILNLSLHNVAVINETIEKAVAEQMLPKKIDPTISRAFKSIKTLIAYKKILNSTDNITLKGQNFLIELEEVNTNQKASIVIHKSLYNEGFIVEY